MHRLRHDWEPVQRDGVLYSKRHEHAGRHRVPVGRRPGRRGHRHRLGWKFQLHPGLSQEFWVVELGYLTLRAEQVFAACDKNSRFALNGAVTGLLGLGWSNVGEFVFSLLVGSS